MYLVGIFKGRVTHSYLQTSEGYWKPYPDNSPPYTFWSWWVVLFHGSGPSGELSWWGIVLGIVVLVGNGWALFLSGGELSSWGVVLEPLKAYNVSWAPEGRYHHRLCTAIAPFWFSLKIHSMIQCIGCVWICASGDWLCDMFRHFTFFFRGACLIPTSHQLPNFKDHLKNVRVILWMMGEIKYKK